MKMNSVPKSAFESKPSRKVESNSVAKIPKDNKKSEFKKKTSTTPDQYSFLATHCRDSVNCGTDIWLLFICIVIYSFCALVVRLLISSSSSMFKYSTFYRIVYRMGV